MCGLHVLVWTDNNIHAEGVAALSPHLGKLVNLQTLTLEGAWAHASGVVGEFVSEWLGRWSHVAVVGQGVRWVPKELQHWVHTWASG